MSKNLVNEEKQYKNEPKEAAYLSGNTGFIEFRVVSIIFRRRRFLEFLSSPRRDFSFPISNDFSVITRTR